MAQSMLNWDKVFRLISKEIRVTHRRSPLAFLWSVFEPMMTVALYAFVFTWLLKSPPLGQSFLLFLASGYAIFAMTTRLADALGSGLRFLKRRKKRWWKEALLARLFLMATISCCSFVVLILGCLWVSQMPDFINWGQVSAAMISCAGLGIGLGILNCALCQLAAIWRQIWAAINRLLFLTSGVFFLPEALPLEIAEPLYWNPLTHLVTVARGGFYLNYRTADPSLVYVWLVSLLALCIGVAILVAAEPKRGSARRFTSA